MAELLRDCRDEVDQRGKRMVTEQDKTDHLEEMEEADNEVQETGTSRDTA